MSPILRPAVNLPEPLRASEIPSFTNYSVVVRLPDIARRTLNENSFAPEVSAQIEALIAEIPAGTIRPVNIPLAKDAAQWDAYIRAYEGMNWLEVPWFFAEEYFYLRILEAVGYFHSGAGQGQDPYAGQKRLGLISSLETISSLADRLGYAEDSPADSQRDTLARLLLVDLWGNQNDLSMWPVQKAEHGDRLTGGKASHSADASVASEPEADKLLEADELLETGELLEKDDDLRTARKNILSDDLPAALFFLDSLPVSSARIDILLDNAGYELVCDLALADYLLTSRRAARVTLHEKTHPVFVSDVIEKDFHETLDFLEHASHPAMQALAMRLRGHLANGSLVLRHHPFWTSPLAAWEMPEDLLSEIARADLLIAKGDANYRRLLGDRHWPIDIPFSSIVDYLPCAVLALRTLKSEIAVGIRPEKVPAQDPEWMINGRWGLVQFALKKQR